MNHKSVAPDYFAEIEISDTVENSVKKSLKLRCLSEYTGIESGPGEQ